MKKRKIAKVMLFATLFVFFSCEDKGLSQYSYNPDKPVTLESFEPKNGGMATKVILSGENLGNDPKQLKVYFNNKLASVIGCDKGKALVVAPRQPGDTCKIAVVIGNDSVVYADHFIYKTMTTVKTLVGIKGSTSFKAGSFSEATFYKPYYLTVDKNKNLFLVTDKDVIMFNQQEQRVTAVLQNTVTYNIPTTDAAGEVVFFPSAQNDLFLMLDPAAQWAPKVRSIIHPTPEEILLGKRDFNIRWKSSFAINPTDKMIYMKAIDGGIVKFDPITKKGELVAMTLSGDAFIQFHPTIPNLLYIGLEAQHAIYTYDLETNELKLFAGTVGQSGYKDGKAQNALFNTPRQFVLDRDGNLILADTNNHCIRKISPEGDVSTLIGIPTKKGYQDGNPEDAMFDTPRGLCIDSEGGIYIADTWNQCIRKLSIE